MNRSLRIRLLIATSLSSAIVLALLGVAIYAAMWQLLMSDYDASLMAKARAISATTEQRDGRVKTEFDPKQMPEFSAREHPEYFEIWLDNGQVLRRSESLQGANLPNTIAAARAGSGGLVLPGTRHARAAAVTFTPRQEDESGRGEHTSNTAVRTCTIVVAGTPIESERMLTYLGWLLLVLCASAIGVSGAIQLRVANGAVRPVKDLARDIERVRETDLTSRLEPQGVPQELAPVVEKLNGLLHRLEKAFAREKSFTADVAHELRTPLAGLLATLEVCSSRPREATAYVSAINECCAMTERMQAMVENLLLLARADAGQLPVERQHVNLASLLKESWLMFESRADARHVQVHWDLCDPCDAITDAEKLRIVIQNLFDNAVSYVEDGGDIRIVSAARNEELLVEIANSGSHVGVEDVPHLFERFWRGDQERSETQVHCGLGLSLSKRLMALLGGTIAAEAHHSSEFIVRLMLPVAKQSKSGRVQATPLPRFSAA